MTRSNSTPAVALMIEGQDGLTWSRWKRLARTAEDAGFDGLFRSDHFTNPEGPVTDSLGLWPSLVWLADNTERIEFGPLVTPTSFRHPVHTARMARDVDDLSGGRLTLGVGTGWQEREHDAFGFDLLGMSERFDRHEEGLDVITRLLRGDGPVAFDGEYFQLEDAELRPKPSRPGGPRVLVGGNGMNRTISLAATYADEFNAVWLPPDEYARRIEALDAALEALERDPGSVRRSLMTRVVFGRDEDELADLLDGESESELRERGVLVGTAPEIESQLAELGRAGADRVMLQWLEQEDLDRLTALADALT